MQNTSFFMGRDGFMWFIGVVEDRNDPERLGRVRVRALGYHTEDKTKIPTESLPWASVMMPVTSPSMSGLGETPFLVQGSWVIGFFKDAQHLQEPIIMGTLPGKPNAYANTSLGFNDPGNNKDYGYYDENTETYSYPVRKDESDINRLAVPTAKDENDDIITHGNRSTRDTAATENVPTALTSTTWNEPKTTDDSSRGHEDNVIGISTETNEDRTKKTRVDSEYPYNQVRETESGHIQEYDDTPYAERIMEYHRTGTFYEIDADGNKMTRVTGNNYEVIAGSDYVNVKGTVNLTIDGNCNTYIKGNYNVQIDGNKSERIGGTYKQSVAGDANETFSSTYKAEYKGLNEFKHTGDWKEFKGANFYARHDSGTDFSCPSDPPRTSGEDCTDLNTPETP